MITAIPNVDPAVLPDLARLVNTYASRYEFRLDGSSLWEGRIKPAGDRNDVLRRTYELATEFPLARQLTFFDSTLGKLATEEVYRRTVERLDSYPAFEEQDWLREIPEIDPDPFRFYMDMDSRTLVAVQDTDLFIVHHPTWAGFEWELGRILEFCEPDQTPEVECPRDLVAGFNFTLAYRHRLANESKAWR